MRGMQCIPASRVYHTYPRIAQSEGQLLPQSPHQLDEGALNPVNVKN